MFKTILNEIQARNPEIYLIGIWGKDGLELEKAVYLPPDADMDLLGAELAEVVGKLDHEGARALDLPAGIPVVAGAFLFDPSFTGKPLVFCGTLGVIRGPAPLRPYNGCYVPFKWRGWWDFGCGALGDMACHIMDMAYWALDLGAPLSVEAESSGPTKETGPDWSTITYQFASRASVGGGTQGGAGGPQAAVEQPAVKFVWYDGKKDGRQNAPYELLKQATRGAAKSEPTAPEPESKRAKKKKAAATVDDPSRWDLILVGDAGTMLFRRTATDWILAAIRDELAATLHEVLVVGHGSRIDDEIG